MNPDRCSCHHIIQRSDVKGKRPKFPNYDVDQLSNLYPFKTDKNGRSKEHERTHRLIEERETKVIYSARKNKKKKGRR